MEVGAPRDSVTCSANKEQSENLSPGQVYMLMLLILLALMLYSESHFVIFRNIRIMWGSYEQHFSFIFSVFHGQQCPNPKSSLDVEQVLEKPVSIKNCA